MFVVVSFSSLSYIRQNDNLKLFFSPHLIVPLFGLATSARRFALLNMFRTDSLNGCLIVKTRRKLCRGLSRAGSHVLAGMLVDPENIEISSPMLYYA